MKKAFILVTLFYISGCSLLDKFMIAPYDNNEYALVNKIRTTAQLSKKDCVDRNVMKTNAETIFVVSSEMKNFSQYLPKNDQSIKPISQLYTMTEELYKRYETEGPVNKTYCELKLTSIEESAEIDRKSTRLNSSH